MITIRPLEEKDVTAVSEIESRTFSMPWKEKDFLEMVKADYAYYYVAEEDGVILGCCGLRNMAGEGEITNVAVDAPFRRRGIAGKLLAHALKEAAEHGIGDCTLEVRVILRLSICMKNSDSGERASARTSMRNRRKMH